MKAKKLRIILTIMGLCIASIPAVAQAATPLVLENLSCPTSLTVNATLKSNVTCGQTIVIDRANITLNLNGYTLSTGGGEVLRVNASGFTLTGGTINVPNSGAGLYAINHSTLNISKVNFQNEIDTGYGIDINLIAQANISNTKFTNLYRGLNSLSSNVNLSNSTFDSNYDGFYSNWGNVVNITGSSFINNEGIGIRQDNAGSFNVSSSKADNNLIGMALNPNYVGVVNINSSFARNNDVTGIVVSNAKFPGKTSSIINSVASGNRGGFGFFLQSPGSFSLKGNLANNNSIHGIYVTASTDYPGAGLYVTGSYNSANFNSGKGLYAEYPVAGTGNTATGNDGGNCFGFVCKK
jgi:parallel beta-helix repeat protein